MRRNDAAHLFADEREQSHFIAGVRVRFAVLHVDDADDEAAIHQRHRKERFVGIFLKRTEGFETGVGRSVARQRDHGIMRRDPAGDAFAHLQTHSADFRIMRKLRGPQYNFIGCVSIRYTRHASECVTFIARLTNLLQNRLYSPDRNSQCC